MTRRVVTKRSTPRPERISARRRRDPQQVEDLAGHWVVVDWEVGEDIRSALRRCCPICSGVEPVDLVEATIRDLPAAADEAPENEEEAPVGPDAPSGHTPDPAGGSREWQQRTHAE